jgi:hypothetical protein
VFQLFLTVVFAIVENGMRRAMGIISWFDRSTFVRCRRRLHCPTQLAFEQLEPRQLLSVNVTTWHNDLTRQGLNANEVTLTPANVNTSTFGKLFSYPVQGQIYAEPLYVSNLAIPGQGTHDVVFVATQNNDIYAFDADSNSGPNSGLLWHINLGGAAAMPNNFFGNRYGPYHDINPQVGITSTPVIDLATGTMYIDSFTNDIAGQNAYSHHIWALDITTGQQKMAPVLVGASIQGNGAGNVGGSMVFTATQQLQRPALTLLNGTLYIAYSGFADTDPYSGWILGLNEANLNLQTVFNTTPNAGTDTNEGEGGIWETGNGLVSDGTQLYVMTANGDFQTSIGDYSDSFLKLTPDSSTQATGNLNGYGLSVTDYFTPYNEQSLADADADLGSGGPMLLPDQAGAYGHLIIGSGKQGTIYVVNRDNMGQHNTSTDNVVQKVSIGDGTFSSPAYFNNTVYYHAEGDVLKAWSVATVRSLNNVLSAAPIASGIYNYGSYPGATPSVSSNGTANGIVWDVQYDGAHAVLRAYNAVPNGTTLQELFDSNQNVARDQLGAGVKFVTPMIADGHVYVGTSGALAVFGLVTPPTTPPAAPSSLAAAALGPSQVKLTWVDNSDNEAGFKIERSTDNVNFAQIDISSANTNSYVDTTANFSTTYYYRIRATNIIGDSAYTTPSAQVTTPASTGPIDVYHFDEGSGTTTGDSAGTNTGTLVGTTKPAWVAGKIGVKALSFNGNGTFRSMSNQSAVQVASDLAPLLGGTATLAAWIKTTQTGGTDLWNSPAITGVEQASGGNDIRWGYLDAAGHIGMGAGDAGVVSNTAINDGQWHHVVFTRDATTGTVQIYIDGVLQVTGTTDTGLKTAPFNYIGAQTDLTSALAADGHTFFNGQLDELRIYNQVLSANEIAGLARIPGAPTLQSATASAGPVVHLSFTVPSSYTQNIEVYRKTGVGGTYAKIATLAASATMYDDSTVVAGTQYYYTVKATDLAGSSVASNELSVTPPVPTIVGNFVFYNDSAYDGNNGSSNVPDYLAIATDKQALLPGQTATFQNYTSYSNGINGIIIDVANLVYLPRLDDFSFLVGNGDPGGWSAAPTPTFVNAYPGRGPGGSTQITVTWADNAIQNEWLKVTMFAQPHLNLAADDVFYFGNAIGETGNAPGNTAVDTADQLAVRSHGTAGGSAGLTNVYDFNRDKQVDSQDELIARTHRSGLSPLKLMTAPTGAGGGAAVTVVETSTLEMSTIVPPLSLAASVPNSNRQTTVDAALAAIYLPPGQTGSTNAHPLVWAARRTERTLLIDATLLTINAESSRPLYLSQHDRMDAAWHRATDEIVETSLNQLDSGNLGDRLVSIKFADWNI